MPFWWRRRRRWWLGRRRYQKRTRKYRRKPRYRRRRIRRAPRRRRKRRRYHKVRRKRKTIPIRQWQPDSIVNCKIKGSTILVLGGEGKQLVCYTNVKQSWVPPKAPGGGGFGCEIFSLGSLYEQYKFHQNIWTKTNIAKDLCRFMWVKLTFYRHPDTDFIISYQRQPPFDIKKETYTYCHPQLMLLAKHKILLLSKFTKPTGRIKKTKKIRPPKQMITKWFFQEHFSTEPLLLVQASACNFNYSNLGCCNTNPVSTFFYINTGFYKQANWDANTTTGYQPYPTVATTLYFWSKTAWDKKTSTTFDPKYPPTTYSKPNNYNDSTSYTTGWFQSPILSSSQVTTDKDGKKPLGLHPTNICRYNPALDTGKGNSIWLVSNFSTDWKKPSSDRTLIYEGLPLYFMLYGFLSYVQYVKKAKDFLTHYILAIECPSAFYKYSQVGAEGPIVPIDTTFVNGQAPYKEDLTDAMKIHWAPNVYNQLEILNTLVESGPLVPKYSQNRNSTWELDCYYNFFFKWGGPEITEPAITDPHLQATYEVPDTFKSAVQIRDPRKQKASSILHPWDIRHGIFTKTALKRMYSNLSTDSTFQPDTEQIQPKKKKVTGPTLQIPQEEEEDLQACLLSLYEESTFQETQNQDIQQLIQQQHEKQQQLKWNILRVLSDMKEQQNLLKLQTGFLN
nr:MAG: ORF1 [Torque teno midi virus]